MDLSLHRTVGLTVGLAVALAVGLGAACSGGDEPSAPAPTTAPEVTTSTISVQHPELGELTFDTLVAGDPAGARDGRLVLLLHGFPETAESYREFLAPLADAGYYAVAVTQRGYSPGARPLDVAAYTIVELVGDVVAVADELGAPTFHVVGHDWGGAVAWLTAALHADRVTSLTALSTPHPDALNDAVSDSTDPQRDAIAYMADFRAVGSEEVFLTDGADSFVNVFGTAGGLPIDKAERFAEVLATPEALRAALNWYRANPLPVDARLGPTTVPTLYVWGSDDIAFVRTTAEATADLVDAPYTYRALEGASHWLPETEAETIVADILPHLAASQDGSPG